MSSFFSSIRLRRQLFLSATILLLLTLLSGCPAILDGAAGDSEGSGDDQTADSWTGSWTRIIDDPDFAYDYSWSAFSAEDEEYIYGREPNGNTVVYSSTNDWQPAYPGIRISMMTKGLSLYGYGSGAYTSDAVGAVYSIDGGASFQPLFTGNSVYSIVAGKEGVDYLFIHGNGYIHRVYTLSLDASTGEIIKEAKGPQDMGSILEHALLVPGRQDRSEAVVAVDEFGRFWIVKDQGTEVSIINGPTLDEGPLCLDQYGETIHLLNGGKLYRVGVSELLAAADGTDLTDLPSCQGHGSNGSFFSIDTLQLHDTEKGSVVIGRSSWSPTGFFSSSTIDGSSYVDSAHIGAEHGFNGSVYINGTYYVFGRELFSSTEGETWTSHGFYDYQGGGDTTWINTVGYLNSRLIASTTSINTDLHGTRYPRIYAYSSGEWSLMAGEHITDSNETGGAVTTPGGRLYIYSDAPSSEGGAFTVNSQGESIKVLDEMVRAMHVSEDTLFASTYDLKYITEISQTVRNYAIFRGVE